MIPSDKKKELAQLANDITGIVNGGRKEEYEYFVDQLVCKHRTLQQSTMRNIVIPLIEKWAEMQDNGWHDLRNQATCELAKDIRDKAINPFKEEQGLPYV